MKTNNWKNTLVGLVIFCFCAAMQIYGQGRGRGGGGGGFGGGGFGGGGFGGGGGGGASSSQQNYTPAGQVGSAYISVDNQGNLVVMGDEATIEQMKAAIAQLDQPIPQVLIKVVFLEVLHTDSMDLGVEGTFGNSLGNSVTGTVAHVFGVNGLNTLTTNFNPSGPVGSVPGLTQNLPGAGLYQILGSDFQATLRAIAQAGKAQLLARPSILARDRQPAMIQIGQNVPLITSVTYNGLTGSPNYGVTYTAIGIILRVTPYITPDGMIQMIIQPETSALDPNVSVPIAVGVSVPAIDIRRADTVVITPDGQTVVIGGLMQDNKANLDNKIPFLGDIPILGYLFKRHIHTGNKNELMIFLTPHVVREPTQLAALSVHEQSQNVVIPSSVSEEELDRFLERVPVKKETSH